MAGSGDVNVFHVGPHHGNQVQDELDIVSLARLGVDIPGQMWKLRRLYQTGPFEVLDSDAMKFKTRLRALQAPYEKPLREFWISKLM